MQDDVILIKNAQLIDGRGGDALRNASILIKGGRFQEVTTDEIKAPGDAHIIEGAGKTILPGLIDMHVHLLSGGFDTISKDFFITYDRSSQISILKQTLYWGVTCVCNPVQPLESGLALRAEIAANAFPSPRLFISGPGFVAPGGYAGTNDPSARMEPNNSTDVKQQVSQLADAKVDFVKIMYDDMSSAFLTPAPKLDKKLMERIIEEAHARNLRVMVCAYETENHKETLRAGADVMTHSAITGPVDDEYIELARKNKALYLGTLCIYHNRDEKLTRDFLAQDYVQNSVPKKTLDTLAAGGQLDGFFKTSKRSYVLGQIPTILENMKRLFDSGVAVGVGPDSGVPVTFPGIAVHREMELMVKAGIPPAQVLVAATKTGAEYLGQESLGTIETGKIADAIIVDGNPIQDIRNTRKIETVIKDGRIIDREKLMQEILES